MTEAPILLLIEDQIIIRYELEDDLKNAGYDVVTSSDGNKALKKIDTDSEKFKAIITDIRLGKGPDGWDIARHARSIVPDMPIIYMSGDRIKEWSSKGVPNSVMLAKPFAAAQLVTAVSNLLNEATTNRAVNSD